MSRRMDDQISLDLEARVGDDGKIPGAIQCPVSMACTAIVRFRAVDIARIAGAVQDPDEWVVILIGERKDNGLLTIVERMAVPEQKRMASHCEFDPIVATDDIVGMLHSHSRGGTFFSNSDESSYGVNSWPVSVVVAQLGGGGYHYNREDGPDIHEQELGFKYRISCKMNLPCGRIGESVGVILADSEETGLASYVLPLGEPQAPCQCPETSRPQVSCGVRMIEQARYGARVDMLRAIKKKTKDRGGVWERLRGRYRNEHDRTEY